MRIAFIFGTPEIQKKKTKYATNCARSTQYGVVRSTNLTLFFSFFFFIKIEATTINATHPTPFVTFFFSFLVVCAN